MKKHSIALVAGMVALVVLASASSWEGSAMMGSYGDFPASGYYAACNSFPRNTSVEVTNLENSRSITVIVTKGLESSGIFMMLSVEAAQALGLQSGRVARVRASEPKSAIELAPSGSSGSSYDPDLNPRLLAAQELKRLGYDLEPTATVATAQKPAVSSPRVEPAPASVPAPVAAEPVAAPAPASQPSATPPAAVPVPETAVPTSTVPATAAPAVSEAPESLAAAKLKPVRTIVLPQLPDPVEPSVSTAAVAAPATVAPVAAPVPESKPEALTILLPEPDETPLRVEPSSIPKRYEAPSVRPDVSTGGPRVPSAPDLAVAMLDPLPVEDARAAAFARSAPELYATTATAELFDPAVPDSESAAALARLAPAYAGAGDEFGLVDPFLPGSARADAIARLAPGKALAGSMPELVWPELEADEIPEVHLASLWAPAPGIPATSLAEGEIILPALTGPSALALETPAYGAAETMVALEDAEVEAVEVPTAEELAGLTPSVADGTYELAEAAEKPGETPLVDIASAVTPYREEGSYELAEAEAKGLEKPSADDVAVVTAPGTAVDGVGLAEAVEQKPETAPLLSGPVEESTPDVTLDQPKEYIIAMEPTGPKPPVAAATPVVPVAPVAPVVKVVPPAVTAAPPITVAPAASAATVSEALEKGRFYIQVGAFGSEGLAKDSAGKLKTGYAILIQKASAKGKDTWRVFVGPLSRDESGVALVRVRAMGYKDAFVKSGS